MPSWQLKNVRALAFLPGFELPREDDTRHLRKGDYAKLAFEFPEAVMAERYAQWSQGVEGLYTTTPRGRLWPTGALGTPAIRHWTGGERPPGAPREPPPPPSGERMWVKVVRVESGAFHSVTVRYKGVLHNDPAVFDDLHWGDQVEFGPENVMSIKRRGLLGLLRRRANLPPS